MSAMGESFGTYGVPHEFKLRDPEGKVTKVYTLSLVDDAVKMALEKRIFERARDVLFSLREGMSIEHYEKRLDKLADDYQEGYFSPFTSEQGQKYLKTKSGALQLMALIFQCQEAEAASLGADPINQAEIETLIKVVLQESFRGIDMKKVEEEAKLQAALEKKKAEEEKRAREERGEPEGNLKAARMPAAGMRM